MNIQMFMTLAVSLGRVLVSVCPLSSESAECLWD